LNDRRIYTATLDTYLLLNTCIQKENDLVMIDQPEDDLDNQTIYEDVIKLVRELKPKKIL
jgi:hypothetical protein